MIQSIYRLNVRHFCWQARDSHLYYFDVGTGNTLFNSCQQLLAIAVLVAIISTLNLTSCAYDPPVNPIPIVSASGGVLDAAITKLSK